MSQELGGVMNITQTQHLFNVDFLAMCMMGLIFFLGLNIVVFSISYMRGDSSYRYYFYRLFFLIISLAIMVSADHLFLFFLACASSNFFLSRLMAHKKVWEAASFSGFFALKNFFFGLFFLGAAFSILYLHNGELSIQKICELASDYPVSRTASIFLLIYAMIQSAILPFHKWLLSSLNSPTPVSAMMHAGVVNGGGFILLRFGPLFAGDLIILQFIFVVGVLTSLAGTIWKLMQHDIKRSLAASTIAQMGFMFAQFGLGLYSVTLAHIILHGLYKAFLFLNSGSSLNQKAYDHSNESLSVRTMIASATCTALTLITFCITKKQTPFPADAHLIPQVVLGVTSFQLASGLLSKGWKTKELLLTFLICSLIGGYYGSILFVIENVYGIGVTSIVEVFNPVYLLGGTLLIISWVVFMYGQSIARSVLGDKRLDQVYVSLLNASQPHSQSITTSKKQYKYQEVT